MSHSKRDQHFLNKKSVFTDHDLAEVISIALKIDFGGSTSAIKTIGNLTGANLRAVKNWYQGKHAPSANHLLLLAYSSPSVLKFILKQVGRDDLLEVFIILSDLNQGNSNLPLKDTYSEYTNRANVPFNVPIRKLNERQQWFLKRLHDHSSISNSEIVDYWCVSQKTAKRDINGLKQMGYISHEGSKRYGNYIVKTIL